MNTYTLKNVFEELSNNNIFVNLEDSYIHTTESKPVYDKKEYIGYLQSNSVNTDEIMESLREEGSVGIHYTFTILSKDIPSLNIMLLLNSILKKFNYEPFIVKNKKIIEIELVVTRNDLTDSWKQKINKVDISDLKDLDELEKPLEEPVEEPVEESVDEEVEEPVEEVEEIPDDE